MSGADPLLDQFRALRAGTVIPDVYLLRPPRDQAINVARQQARAHNLAWRLTAGADASLRIAVVGGGFAGLTFAVAAARNGAAVTLLDHSDRLVFTQWKSYDRYLHPTLFDWPDGSWRRGHTEHTALAWKHNFASAVRSEALAQVPEDLALDIRLQHFVRTIDTGPTVAFVALADGALVDGTLDADCVVVASGFPMERPKYHALGGSYWRTPADMASVEGEGGVRIVGSGDGGLTELITLALEGFRQDNLRALVHEAGSTIALDPTVESHDFRMCKPSSRGSHNSWTLWAADGPR